MLHLTVVHNSCIYLVFSRDELRMAELTVARGLVYFVKIRQLDILAGNFCVVKEGRRLCSQFRITSSLKRRGRRNRPYYHLCNTHHS